MKIMNAKKLAILFFLIITTIQSQHQENYFPHAIGNTWQYMYDDGRMFKYEIVKDSLLADSSLLIGVKNTLIYLNNSSGFRWDYWVSKKQDSIIESPNMVGTLEYRFPMVPGDKWIRWDTIWGGTFGHCFDKYIANVFEITTTTFKIDFYHADSSKDTTTYWSKWRWSEYIADGFGKIWWGNEVEYYQLMGCIIDGVKYGTITNVEDNLENEKPNDYCLYQNYPNPFNPTTRIEYQLPNAGFVTLKIYNSLGEEVAILINERKEVGKYSVEFNSSNLPSGIYFYQLRVNEYIQVRKMLLIK
jgi:hypothetical protein